MAATKIVQKVQSGKEILATRVFSEKLGHDVWILHNDDLWEIIRSGVPIFSRIELEDVKAMPPESLKLIAAAKRALPGTEISKYVAKNRTNKGAD